MGFLNDAKQQSNNAPNTNKLPLIELQLGKKDFDEFVAALKDKSISASAIHRVLKSRGVEISENSIRKYRSNLESK